MQDGSYIPLVFVGQNFGEDIFRIKEMKRSGSGNDFDLDEMAYFLNEWTAHIKCHKMQLGLMSSPNTNFSSCSTVSKRMSGWSPKASPYFNQCLDDKRDFHAGHASGGADKDPLLGMEDGFLWRVHSWRYEKRGVRHPNGYVRNEKEQCHMERRSGMHKFKDANEM